MRMFFKSLLCNHSWEFLDTKVNEKIYYDVVEHEWKRNIEYITIYKCLKCDKTFSVAE
jgi:hypothetical protein